MNQHEQKLLERILKGDQTAFRELHDSYKKILIHTCWNFLGNDSEVEEIVRETYIKALKNLHHFRFESSLTVWLNHIAINLCRDYLDKKMKTSLFFSDFFTSDLSESIENKIIYSDEVLKHFKKEIEILDGVEKDLIELREIKGMSYEAIANHLRIPVGSVISGISKVRKKIIEKVREEMPQFFEEVKR